MHIPSKFNKDNTEELIALMREYPFATLVTHTLENGIDAHHIPVSVLEVDKRLCIRAHVSIANPVWKAIPDGSNVLVIFNGPNCYISPNHYPTKKETGKAVPTWNYVVVHAKGKLSFIQNEEWIRQAIDTLTSEHESTQSEPWSISDAPEPYIQKMLQAVVGLEIEVESIEGQWKLSQNQPELNQHGVIAGLSKNQNTHSESIAEMIRSNIEH